ncbi:MAG: hypothetical protein ACJ8AT_34985, partial [Hyalangium sp.]|uniref:hypothetical protein n=1 Tax=Hyalangium sp. TaxID=2028555 RepID=UPI003899E68C
GTKAIQVGGMWLTSTEGSRQESIAADSSMRVGGNCWEEVEGTASITTNKDISINVGTYSRALIDGATTCLAKTFDLKADKFSIVVNGQVALRVEKSGNIQIFGKTITLDES